MSDRRYKAVIVGAGPAGLTAAYELCKNGQSVVVLESDPRYVGGISRTVEYHGYRLDIGGHRFFSKSREIEDLWTEILGADLLERQRSSRICYRGKFFSYPLKPFETLSALGVMETEKVWGMSCKEISADWAAQRIKGLTLGGAISNALRLKGKAKNRTQVVKTLIDTFRYPRLGPGMMWDACADKVRSLGGEVLLGRSVVACRFDEADSSWTVTARLNDGTLEKFRGEHLVSSMPIQQLVAQIEPLLPESARRSASSLRYRDFLTIALILPERHRFSDNWIYVHDPDVKVGRVQNYKSWSPEMVPDPGFCCYGLEYFCFEGDKLWSIQDADLIALAGKELEQIGLGLAVEVADGCVIRQPKAYPVYDDDYQRHVGTIRSELSAHFRNLHLVGRNGMHKYNNQDHAMMTALLAARNILAGENRYDVWSVNEDGEYHESGWAGEQPASIIERALRTESIEENESAN
jgi:protoporphyrinogen oxidase